jgi:anti-anti-sigma regulatory factor
MLLDAWPSATDGAAMDEPTWRLLPPDYATLVIRAPATLTHETAEPLRACAERRLPNRDDAGLVLDMSDVRLITSIGIAALLQVQDHTRAVTGDANRFRLAALPGEQLEFLTMLKLDAAFAHSETVDDATAALGE